MKRVVNGICVILGFVCFGLGAVGAVMPVIPTTPFLLAAAFFFARGSERFHKWFVSTNLYKRYIEQAVKKKAMDKTAKRNMLITLGIVFTLGIIFSPMFAKGIIFLVAAFHFYYFLFRIKTVPEGQERAGATDQKETERVLIQKKREQEKAAVGSMIAIYCHGMHKTKRGMLCEECRALHDYAALRTEKCPFMETKTFCSACKVHCYSKEMQEKIRLVMRYAGPRMLFVHPMLALRHMKVTLDGKRKEKRQSQGELAGKATVE